MWASIKHPSQLRREPCQPVHPATDLARCFLRLANLPNFALDRLSRYEANLWRQVGQILFALDALDRRKPQERSAVFMSVVGKTDRPTDVTTGLQNGG
jgi:hypothetical protein